MQKPNTANQNTTFTEYRLIYNAASNLSTDQSQNVHRTFHYAIIKQLMHAEHQ